MQSNLNALLLAALLAPAAFAADEPANVSLQREVDRYLEKSAAQREDPGTMRVFFKQGLHFESADGAFKLKLFGRIMWDSFFGDSSDFSGLGVAQNASFFRRIRIGMSGTVYRRMIFKWQLDFAKGTTTIKDMYVGLKQLPAHGTLKIGNHFEAFSLQELTSSKYIQLIERATVVNAFAPARHVGVSSIHLLADERLTVQAGVFFGEFDSQAGAFMGTGGGAFSLRITGVAAQDPDRHMLLHLGFGFSFRDVASQARFRARPGVGDKERLVDTGAFAANEILLFSFELAFQWRSVTLQAEYMRADVDSPAFGDPNFGGFYVEIGWFITGEIRTYDKHKGAWGRTKPNSIFYDGSGGAGAWQLVFRFGQLDLNDGGITGGEQDTFTVGVNWHWNPNTRVMANVVFADVTDAGPLGAGDVTIVVIRMQFDF